MLQRSILPAVIVVLFGSLAFPHADAADQVDVRKVEGDQLKITINGAEFSTYNFSSDLPKPFFMPVTTAQGVVLNRALNDPADADHPHHKGLWNAVDEVNGVQFWAERGKIVNISCLIEESGQDHARFRTVNEWRHPETGKAEVTENTVVSIYPNRLVVYDMTFTTTQEKASFEDTKEGLFGFRVAPSMKEKNGGRITASDGSTGSKDCWGKTFPWIDYSGEVGEKTVGVTIMDHPDNFRPSRYHVRDYGLFSISPFGEKAYTRGESDAATVEIHPGESLRLRYAILIHDGGVESAGIEAAWQQFRSLKD